MKSKFLITATGLMLFTLFFYSLVLSKPSFNGNSTPGCDGSGCHNLKSNILSVATQGNLQVAVTVTNVSSGKKLAGELVDENGTVVDMIDKTSSNPFILTAPAAGHYTINAGYKSPKEWDSTSVTFNVTTGIDDPVPTDAPQAFELYPNHPNPFNPETLIRFSLPKAGQAKLTIYNINGQVVRTLVNGNLSAGLHSFRWDGHSNNGEVSPSGVYIYEVISGGQRQAKRMTLTK